MMVWPFRQTFRGRKELRIRITSRGKSTGGVLASPVFRLSAKIDDPQAKPLVVMRIFWLCRSLNGVLGTFTTKMMRASSAPCQDAAYPCRPGMPNVGGKR